MKNRTRLIICLTAVSILAGSLAGCGGSGAAAGRNLSQSAGVNQVLESGMAQADKEKAEETAADPGAAASSQSAAASSLETTEMRESGVNEGAPEPETQVDSPNALSETEGIDVDLTILSSTMVYSEVYNMMMVPDEYIGKTIKMRGICDAFDDPFTGKRYYACIIQDATACCAQGIEFVLNSSYNNPEDYPEIGSEITVSGIFETYKEGEYVYCNLREAELLS